MRLRSTRVVVELASTKQPTKRRAPSAVASAAAGVSKRGKNSDAGAPVGGAAASDGTKPIWTLGAPEQLVRAVLLKRPSAVIKSAYVADVRVEGESAEALAWVPCLDLGGTCVPGCEVLMTRSTNPSTKTQYAVQCAEEQSGPDGCWIGAAPALAEKLVREALRRGLVPELRRHTEVRAQVKVKGEHAMRTDFMLRAPDTGERIAVEVKNVVCSDHPPAAVQRRDAARLQLRDQDPAIKMKAKFPMYTSASTPYQRAAIFPWGKKNQEWDGEKCVSERAIKHLHGLMALAAAAEAHVGDDEPPPRAAVLFVVNRGDCLSFHPHDQACPVFARTLRQARAAGVLVLAAGVAWREDGVAMWTGPMPIVL